MKSFFFLRDVADHQAVVKNYSVPPAAPSIENDGFVPPSMFGPLPPRLPLPELDHQACGCHDPFSTGEKTTPRTSPGRLASDWPSLNARATQSAREQQHCQHRRPSLSIHEPTCAWSHMMSGRFFFKFSYRAMTNNRRSNDLGTSRAPDRFGALEPQHTSLRTSAHTGHMQLRRPNRPARQYEISSGPSDSCSLSIHFSSVATWHN
jgi:hypothetical protein